MPFSSSFLSTHDIDWFIFVNRKLVHVASAGGFIPEAVLNNLDQTYYYVASLPDINSTDSIDTIDQHFLSNQIGISSEERENYLWTFMKIAQKGIYSFDRTVITDIQDNNYHLVAWPNNEEGGGGLFVNENDSDDCPILSVRCDLIDFNNPLSLRNVNLIEIVERGLFDHEDNAH